MKSNNQYDTNAAWNKLYNKLNDDGLLPKKQKLNLFFAVKIAALFIISFSIGIWVFQSFTSVGSNMQLAETFSKEQIQTVQLPDGSTVDLNVNSRLRYPEKFESNSRIVELQEGEAFFTVIKNPDKPFIIKVIGREVKVLGTSFDVKADKTGKQVKVIVKTGKVHFYEAKKKEKQLILEAGFEGTISKKTVQKTKIKDPNYLAWKTKYFDFSYGEQLGTVIEKLNNAYHVNIVLENKNLNNKVIYTTYHDNSLDTILRLIAIVHDLKIEKQNDKIILK